MPTDWLDLHSGGVQAFSAVVLVLVTLVLVWVTYTYAEAAKRQAEQTQLQVQLGQQQRYDLQRPILHPTGTIDLVDWTIDFTQSDVDIPIQNVGTGVALTVCGVLFPPLPSSPSNVLAERYTLWNAGPLLPTDRGQTMKFERGRTKIDGNAMLVGHTFHAPRKPSREEQMLAGKYNIVGRLTLTYSDVFGRNHAAIFDYIDIHGWQLVEFAVDLQENLEDLDAKTQPYAATAATPS